MEECIFCREKWFNMDVSPEGICRRCKNAAKLNVYSESNNMNPGPSIQELDHQHGMKVPEPLSQVEEMISRLYM